MQRLPPISFDQLLPESDEQDEGALSGDHATPPDRIKLGVAWLCATAAGIAALVYSTMSQVPQMYTMGGLVGVLVMYAAYGLSLRKKNTVQFADSLYYMGFLWAVFALIATFVAWPAPKLTADAVLTTFGYALVATFSGMLFRMLAIQFQATLSDRIISAQETIDRRVAALARQIDGATMDIATFTRRAANELGGALNKLVRALDETRDKITEQQRTMTATMSAGFESSVKEMLGRLAAIQIPQDLLTTEVGKLVAALGKRGGDVEQAVQQLEKSLTQAAETVTRLGDSLYGSEAAKRIGAAVNELSTTIQDRTQEFGSMTTALESSRAELESQLKSMQSLRSAFGNVSTQLSTLEAQLKDVSAQSLSAEIRNGLLDMQQAIQSSLAASKAIETAMRGAMSFLKESVTGEQVVHGK
jgi:predicted  nucleic acid-binding Zn-ribbon protein